MHSKYHRRLSHAERAPKIWNRQVSDNTTPTNSGNGEDDDFPDVNLAGGFLTGPITLTFVSTIQSSTQSRTSTTSTTSSSTTSSSTSSTSSTTQQTSTSAASTAESTSQTPIQTPVSSTPSPSVIFSSGTPSGSASGSNSTSQPETGALSSSTKLTGGSIAGIVIGCLLVLGALIFYLIRARSQRSRMRLRSRWNRPGALDLSPGISSTSYEPKPYLGDAVPSDTSPVMRFAPASQQASLPAITTIAAPAISYNNAEVSSPLTPDSTYGSPYDGFTSPSPNPAIMGPFTAAVISTFITTLPDELSIKVGETVRILAEYDDGWALCMTGNGEQGMVPLECLNRGSSANGSFGSGGLTAPTQDRDARGIRRVSSLNPTAQALKVYRS